MLHSQMNAAAEEALAAAVRAVRDGAEASRTDPDAAYRVYSEVFRSRASRRTRHSILPEWLDYLDLGFQFKGLAPGSWMRGSVLKWKLAQLCAMGVPGQLTMREINTDPSGPGLHWLLRVDTGGQTYYFDPSNPSRVTESVKHAARGPGAARAARAARAEEAGDAAGVQSLVPLGGLLGEDFKMETLRQQNLYDCGIMVCMAAEAVAAKVQGRAPEPAVGWKALEYRARLAVEYMAATLADGDGAWEMA